MGPVLPPLSSVGATRGYAHEPLAALRRDRAEIEPLRLRGGLNALGLALVVLAVAFLHAPWRGIAILGLGGGLPLGGPAPGPPGQRGHPDSHNGGGPALFLLLFHHIPRPPA